MGEKSTGRYKRHQQWYKEHEGMIITLETTDSLVNSYTQKYII